jgi:hypothetical protein
VVGVQVRPFNRWVWYKGGLVVDVVAMVQGRLFWWMCSLLFIMVSVFSQDFS